MTRSSSARLRSRDHSFSAWGGVPRHGIQSACEEPVEDTNHRVLAPQYDLGDLGRGLTLSLRARSSDSACAFRRRGFISFCLSSLFHISPSHGYHISACFT